MLALGLVNGIHDTASVHPEASIHSSVTLGKHCVIGKCVIGEGSRIGDFSTVKDGAIIGKNVVIREYCLIGGSGFGFSADTDGKNERIPHIGVVVIEDDVEIFPFA